MKLITKKGITQLCEKYNAKLAKGNHLTPYIELYIEDKDDANKAVWSFRNNNADYHLSGSMFTIRQEQLQKFLPESWFEEVRVWLGQDLYYLCSKMDHQHLSNCIGYLDLLLQLNKISKEKSTDYMARLSESIIPELEERFGGELLPYKPKFEWEHRLIKELADKKK